MATLSTAARNAAVNGVTALLNSGTIKFQTAGGNEVAVCGFAATAFGAADAGTATAGAISSDTSAIAGTVSAALLRASDTSTIITCTCTTSGGGGDFIFTSLSIGTGDTVSVTSLTITQPAS